MAGAKPNKIAAKLKQLWSGGNPAKPSKLAWAAFGLAAASAVAALAVGLAHRFEWMAYQPGFLVLRITVWSAAAGGLLGIVALIRAGTGARRRGWAPGLLALIVGLAYVAVPAYWALVVLPKVPRIHDISTDTDNPPAFAAIAPLRAKYVNPAAYDGPEVAALQKQAYPDLVPLQIAKPPAAVFAAALETVQLLGLDLVNGSEKDGLIEASSRTTFFGFVDDVAIRVRAAGSGTRVDVRSKSREGRSDFGVNAARVRKLVGAIQTKAG